MSENNESIKIYRCNICNKNYSSQSSLCNHTKKFHTNIINTFSNLPQKSSILPQIPYENNLICIYCNKHYSRLDNIKRHYNTCKKNINNGKINIPFDIKNNLEKMEKENIEIKNMLKELLEKNCKIHPKTLQKNNNDIMDVTSDNINNIDTSELFSNDNNKIINSNDDNNNIIKSNDNKFIVDINKNFMTFNDKAIKFFYYNDQVYFKAKHVAKMLDYGNTKQAIQNNVYIDDKIKISKLLEGGLSHRPPSPIGSFL